jgi:tRNA (guanine26-N2/guanine27-N2)-dimethyltransferase
MGTQPVFSYYTDHYVRVNAIVKYGAKQADQTLTEMGYVFHCFKCFHRETVSEYKLASNSMVCRECGSKLSLAGPLWIGKIIDKAFAEDMLHEAQKRLLRQNLRIETTLSLALAEADKTPGYYDVDAICDSLNLPVPPPSNVTSLLTSMGLDATPTLFCSSGLRSNATANQVRSAVLAALEDRTEGK